MTRSWDSLPPRMQRLWARTLLYVVLKAAQRAGSREPIPDCGEMDNHPRGAARRESKIFKKARTWKDPVFQGRFPFLSFNPWAERITLYMRYAENGRYLHRALMRARIVPSRSVHLHMCSHVRLYVRTKGFMQHESACLDNARGVPAALANSSS